MGKERSDYRHWEGFAPSHKHTKYHMLVCKNEVYDKDGTKDGREELGTYFYKSLTLHMKW